MAEPAASLAQASKTLTDYAPGLPRPAVMCTLVSVSGSAPQAPGARMWVSVDAFDGTLGGGRFEASVLSDARALLSKPGAAPFLKEYVLCKEMGQCCGGRVQVFFEPVQSRRVVHVFGGGHVGRALASVLAGTPVAVELIDPRPEWSVSAGLPPEARVTCADPRASVKDRAWTGDDAVCILTHSHDLDFDLLSFFWDRPVGYLGLIGSEHKARVFQARLQTQRPGEDVESLWEERVRCPMGETLPSKNPKAIAVSISMELLRAWALR